MMSTSSDGAKCVGIIKWQSGHSDMPKKSTTLGVDVDTLRKLRSEGADHPLIDLRLRYMEAEGVARYLRGIEGRSRVYPSFLPTQASGRWSCTGPPLVNFPAHAEDECERCQRVKAGELPEPEGGWCPRAAREVVLPDKGWYWVHFDLDGIEGRFCSAYSNDKEELDAYRQGWDLHTLNASDMFNMPRPPIYTKAVHASPEAQEWRDKWSPPWGGGSDRRRHLAKTLKYATQFARDHRGANDAKGVEKLGLTKAEVERFAKMYLAAKPILTAHKRKKFEEYARTSVSRTFRGRRRRLAGDAWTRAKEGWSHEVQGSVPDIMNDYIIQVAGDDLLCEGYLILNSHDGLTWALPESVDQEEGVRRMKQVVEREWDVRGVKMPVSAEWEVIEWDGTKRAV